MGKRQWIYPLAALAAMAFSAPAAIAQSVSADVVKIGVLTDLSGVYSDISGPGSVLAAQLAVQNFSADGTVLGKRIEVVSADHQNKPDVASNKAREWYDRDQVDVIVDLVNSTAALAVMDIAEQKKRLTLVSGAAAMPITNERCTAYNVHWVYDLHPLTNSLPTEVVKQGQKRWFFVVADYAPGHYVENQAAQSVQAAGGEVIGAVRHPLGATDMSSFLLRAQSSKADVIALASTGQDAINAINQAVEFGISDKQTIVPLLMVINDVHQLGLQQMQGARLIEAFYWDRNEQTRAFAKQFFEKRKHMPNMVHAGVYSSVLNYLKAVQQAGTDDADAVMQTLKSMEIDDGLFQGRIRSDGRFMHDMLMVEVKTPAESSGPWDYYKIQQVISAEAAAQPLSQSKCKLVL
ncbi:ABC transporter substrate-binding protein [Lampropedia aestuarii]|uniref:ABC transporter substrate-binding protein n=1 Tax=Lampropedia aestuarii TaxID=2562762 RepID=UPI002469AD17|nr:ABC transporter substrate-binding protein [Lampropedia aestuarii]MDH5856474.1 ABC transporter substrate-binding protein [Lampropedia aestuarii]